MTKFELDDEVFVEQMPGKIRKGKVIDREFGPLPMLLISFFSAEYPNESEGTFWIPTVDVVLCQTAREMFPNRNHPDE